MVFCGKTVARKACSYRLAVLMKSAAACVFLGSIRRLWIDSNMGFSKVMVRVQIVGSLVWFFADENRLETEPLAGAGSKAVLVV